MSDKTIQAVYQACTDHQLSSTPDCDALGREFLNHLSAASCWALLQASQPPGLQALYLTAALGGDFYPAPESCLQNQPLQESAARLAAKLAGPGPWWVFLGPSPPELRQPPRLTDLSRLPVDEQLAISLRQPPLTAGAPKLAPRPLSDHLKVDPVSIEVSKPLVALVGPEGSLFNRITLIRNYLAAELGIIIPGVRFRDNPGLGAGQYLIKVREQRVAQGRVQTEKLLCVGKEEWLKDLPGESTADPTYGMPAKWIDPVLKSRCQAQGGLLFDSVSVIATQLTECLRDAAAELLTLEDAEFLLHQAEHARVLKALEKQGFEEIKLWRILRELLEERVSIRDLRTLLQGLLLDDDPALPAREKARRALSTSICAELSEAGRIRAVVLSGEAEQILLGPDFSASARLTDEFWERCGQNGCRPLLLSSEARRWEISQRVRKHHPRITVLCRAELAPQIELAPLT